LLAVVAAAAVAGPAQAEMGLVGYFKVPPFTGPVSIDAAGINHNGTGGTAPGDVFFSGTVPVNELGPSTEQYSALGQAKGRFPGAGDIAIDQATGKIFYEKRVLAANGEFLLSHGFDAVRSGPDDSNVDEQQRVTVIATGGTFTFSCCFNNGASVSTKPLPYNASAAEVKTAVDEMIVVKDPGSSVTVTGGPGDAAGSHPYTITFDGGEIAGDDVEKLQVNGKLAGSFTSLTNLTTVSGGAVEICTVADVCRNNGNPVFVDSFGHNVGGALNGAEGVALAPPGPPNAGDLLVGDRESARVSEFTPAGVFVRTFGWDVNAHGVNDSTADEQQKLTIDATGGRFSLSLPFRTESTFEAPPAPTTGATGHGNVVSGSSTIANVSTEAGEFASGEAISGVGIPAGTTIVGVAPGELTLSAAATQSAPGTVITGADLAYDSSSAQVEAALNAMPSLSDAGASVSVSGPSGGPFTITFGGAFGGDNIPAMSSSAVSLTGGEHTATVSTVANGGAFEVCVQSAGDVCKSGEAGSTVGQFRGGIGGIAEDSSGAVYVVEAAGGFFSNGRVQKFTPSGSGFVPSLFGSDEVQKLTVNASAGQFRLAFGAEPDTTTGTANVVVGSNVLTNVVTNTGQFSVGQPIKESTGGNTYFIPSNTLITAIGTSTITMSKAATQSSIGLGIHSDTPYVTSDLPFNATAAAVESALNALPSVGGFGASVVAGGGPGDAGGTSPYTVTFSGGKLHDADVPQMVTENGTTALSGGSGAGADQAVVVTERDGGPRGLPIPESTSDPTAPMDVAVDGSDHVLIAKAFALGASKCADGSPSPNELRIVRYDTAGMPMETSAPCLFVPPGFTSNNAPNLSVDPINGEPYLSVDMSGFQQEVNPVTGDGMFVLVFGDTGTLPSFALDQPSNLGPDGVTISGTINPHGPVTAAGHPNPTNTTYRIEYREQGESNWTTYALDTSVGTGSVAVPFTIGVSGLTPKTTYEIRTVVSKLGFLAQFGAPQTITTVGAAPTVDAFTTSNVTASAADLEAVVNPLGTATSYHFEYGKTPAYGQSTPETTIGEAQSGVAVADHIGSLEPVVYHFRIVANNAFGTTTSADQTFSFYPESCPNSIVRAQTGSGSLPDCRGYELVSPSDSGAASLTIGGPNSPYATPSRLAFFGFFGSIPGPWNPQNVFGDMYVATRSAAGWSTHYVGIPADQRPSAGGPPNGGIFTGSLWRADPILSSRSMDRFLDWEHGQQGLGNIEIRQSGSMAPYMWGADGAAHGRLPTNAAEIPNGEADLREYGFNGDMKPSADFSHYFFSSSNVAFAPGGLTSGNGSVYDNDLATGTVEIVSKLSNGSPIPEEPGDEEDDYFTLPAASIDGSHILIAATGTAVCGHAKCPSASNERIPCYDGIDQAGAVGAIQKCPENLPSHLYMRVGGGVGGVTYDVSGGAVVHYDGMTSDGSKVYFTSHEDLTEDNSDNDSSVDLYMWSEVGDTITRVSSGSGSVGNTDNCNSAWIAGCGVEVVPSMVGMELLQAGGFEQAVHGGALRFGLSFSDPTDNSIAAVSGDIYFYSPEQFVASKGVPGRRNLYVFRSGQIQFVATLDADKPTSRFQITPSGSRAAFITDSRLTTYDNAGYDEMYTFTPSTGQLVCVSCIPSGQPPTSYVVGSQNGIFMSDDGRTFFATESALLPADTNGLTDVYEYVDGRPRLISSGVASIQKSSLGEAGLVGVSADGIDVYIGTFDRLVAGDQNGQLLRFYDARSGGGFPQTTVAAPCAAADECHAPPNQTESLPAIGSSADLGSGGNLSQATKKTRKHRKHHKRRRRHHGRHVRSGHGGRG
jgi:hypothetical protein